LSRLIGATWACDAGRATTPQAGLRAVLRDDLAALVLDGPADDRAAARAALGCLHALPAFAPVARGGGGGAADWLAAQGPAIRLALGALAGRAELVATLAWDAPDPAADAAPTPADDGTGRGWLRARAALRAARADRAAATRDALAVVLREAGFDAEDVEAAPARAEACVLLACADAARAADAILEAGARALAGRPDARLEATGPWPAYAAAARLLAPAPESAREAAP
jgi:hypothetical protein